MKEDDDPDMTRSEPPSNAHDVRQIHPANPGAVNGGHPLPAHQNLAYSTSTLVLSGTFGDPETSECGLIPTGSPETNDINENVGTVD